jgi:purine-binding chemotaxis protein CheW
VRGNPVDDDHALIARVGAIACAIPIAHVVETMRPLPIEPLGDAPRFIRGVAIIRGAPTVVVDTARMLGLEGAAPTRFVTVRAGDRTLALTFDEVFDVRRIARATLATLPPLLRATAADAIDAIGTTDDSLLVLLETARTITHEQWASLERGAAR